MKWFKKKETPEPLPIRVFMKNRPDSVDVLAVYRTIKANGTLTLHDGLNGADVVADFAAGEWTHLLVDPK